MKDWTFKSSDIAENFDSHVREQLPWYELVTESIAYIARNYLPEGGLIYDIGASTGNMTSALLPLAKERRSLITAIENSPEMCEQFYHSSLTESKNVRLVNADAITCEYENYDVAVLMLTAMFLPVESQELFFDKLYQKLNHGGAIIVVDKTCDENGYFATVMKRLTMYWKLKNGATPDDIMKKELSLSGIQRPIDVDSLPNGARQFFQLGEFKGWVIEK